MNERQLLVNREFQAHDRGNRINWYTSLNNIREDYKSVESANFYNTMSSAGDWSGYIVQKIKNNRYLILFSQENNWPKIGYTIYTGSVLAFWQGELTEEEILQIVDDVIS
jgi:hypothetical protein